VSQLGISTRLGLTRLI